MSRILTIAHRGASAHAPENTLAAIRNALARDADLVELDVQRTKDGELVVLHDTTLDRTTDVRRRFPGRAPWRLSDFTLAEIRTLDAGSWKSSAHAGERIPTLAEALAVLAGSRAGALLELKAPALYPGIAAEVTAVVHASPLPRTAVVLQSFDVEVVHDLARADGSLALGVLGRPDRTRLPEIAEWAGLVNVHHRRIDRAYVDAVHGSGLRCFTWTVNRSSAMRRAASLGVDGVVTDHPDVAHRVTSAALLRT